MSATNIVYNGVPIANVLTEGIDHQVVFDSSNVNPIAVRVTVSGTGLIHRVSPGIPKTIGVGVGADLAAGFNMIIDQLMQPGRAFAMYVGDTALFDVVPGHVRPGLPNPNAGDGLPIRRTDVNHGPIPSIHVLEIISANTMKIQFRIVMHLPYTDRDGYKLGGAVSFRWWIVEDIDYRDATTTRTYQGTLRVRHVGHNVLTEIRNNFVFPPLVSGFQRQRISLNQKPNGLELDFTVTDKEVWAAAPSPATRWEGYQTQFTAEKLLLVSEVSVTVWGDKKTPKNDLLVLCRKILDTKLHRLDMSAQGQTFLRSLRIRDSFTENKIEASASVNMIPSNKIIWNLEKGNFGQPLNVGFPSSPSEFPTYNKELARTVSPTACIKGLFLAALQDPLHVTDAFRYPEVVEDARQVVFGALDCGESAPTEPEIPAETDRKVSSEHLDSAYTVYCLTSETDKNWGTIALPVGKSSSGEDTAAILKLHQPTANLRVRMEAERINQWPTLPSPQEYSKLGCQFTPLRTPITGSSTLSGDYRKTLYHVSAELHFGQNKEATGGIPAGLLPYRVAGQDNVYVIPSSVFSDKILFA